MKKQLLIAAVAATMTSVAFADISITGGAKINYTNTDYELAATDDTNLTKHDVDFTIVGKNGGTGVTMTVSNAEAADNGATTALTVENVFVTSSVAGVNVKAGQWDNGDNLLRASARMSGKASFTTTISGVTATYESQNDADDFVKLSGDVAGVAVSYKHLGTSTKAGAGEDITVSGSVAGVAVSYLALNRDADNANRSVVTVSGSFGGVDMTYAQATADSAACIQGDGWMGDFENADNTCDTSDSATNAMELNKGQDVSAMKLSTAMAGNTVAFTRTLVDGVTGKDATINKFVVTRPLASGATFEATYTDLDDEGQTATDSTTLDLELAVKF